MLTRRTIATALATAMALGACPAAARSSAPAHALAPRAQERALAIALGYWRAHDPQLMPAGLPSCGRPQIRWAPRRGSEGGEAIPEDCRIILSSTAFELPAEAPLVCETILHETGHLLGLAHSANAYSPMYPDIWRIVPACRRFSTAPPRPNIASGID